MICSLSIHTACLILSQPCLWPMNVLVWQVSGNKCPTRYTPGNICPQLMLWYVVAWLDIGWFNPYPSGLLYWHEGSLMIAPVLVKQPRSLWLKCYLNPFRAHTTTRKQSTTKPCLYFMGYTEHCIYDLVQDCCISIANTLEIPQSCTKPSSYLLHIRQLVKNCYFITEVFNSLGPSDAIC